MSRNRELTIDSKAQLKPEDIIKQLNLVPHPEGGWYRRTYQSQEQVGTPYIKRNQNQTRFLKTGIYYLLSGKEKSLLHRIKSDEMWHFYFGDPLTLVELAPSTPDSDIDHDLRLTQTTLGHDLINGQIPQYTVKKGHWFGGYLKKELGFCLVGCTVAPGFDFEDFEMACGKKNLSEFKDHPVIQNLLPSN